MYYGEINKTSITDGVGVRVALYVSGCRIHCKGCHNPESWDFNFGKPYTKDTENEIIDLCKKNYIKGLSILGGEPFEPENQRHVYELVKRFRETFGDEKDIWIWTGYELSDLQEPFEYKDIYGLKRTEFTDYILDNLNVLVAGPYIENLRDVSKDNPWRGSINQHLYVFKKCPGGNDISYD